MLVIEDEPEMRRKLTTILRLENFHALPAAHTRTLPDQIRAAFRA
jgi:DNA-binding response OmpR family regulator